MTKQEIIQQIITLNPEPDQSKCPELWLNYYDSKKLVVRKNANTGEIQYQREFIKEGKKWTSVWEFIKKHNETPNRGVFVYSPRASLETAYMKNWRFGEERVLEIASVTIDGHRGLGARDWKFYTGHYNSVPRIFMFEGDAHIYNADGTERFPEEMKTFNHHFVSVDCYHLQMFPGNRAAAEEAKRFFKVEDNVYPWKVRELYKKSVRKPRKPQPMDDIANREYDWPDLKNYPLSERKNTTAYYSNVVTANSNVIYCMPVEEYLMIRILTRHCVLENNGYEKRIYYVPGNYYPCPEDVTMRGERTRIIISPKGEIGIYTTGWDHSKTYVRTSARVSYSYSWYGSDQDDQFVYLGFENLAKINKTKYLVPVLEKVKKSTKLQVLVNAIRHPILEQMYKAGFENIANYLNEGDEVAASLKKVFNVKEKRMPLTKLLDMNTYQLKKMEELFKTTERGYSAYDVKKNILVVMKQLSGVDTFASLSKETTDELFEIGKVLINASLWYQDLRDTNNWWYRNRYDWDGDMTREEAKQLLKICKFCKNSEGLRMYIDTCRLYRRLPENYRPDIDIYDIDNMRSLEIIHDDLIRITNVFREESQRDRENKIAEGFKSRYPKTIKRYGVTGPDFLIDAPETPSALTTEGAMLSHCVGGYLESVGTGGTTILFLRKPELPSTPFYTIEVSGGDKEKNPRLIQIHGYRNKWLGNNPEAIPFVKKWLEEHDITYDKNILLCNSEGYGSCGKYIDGKEFGL